MRRAPLKIDRRLLALLASGVALLLLASLMIVVDGVTDRLGRADVAIVLASKVERDGRPARSLQARLNKARELYEQGLFDRLIVSGGVGREGYDEALVMRDYLVERGIPAERIHVDSEGVNTYQTARNAAGTMEAEGYESALIVTQYFHIPRARMALRRFGVSEIYTAHAEIVRWRDLYSIPREVAAWIAYQFKPYN